MVGGSRPHGGRCWPRSSTPAATTSPRPRSSTAVDGARPRPDRATVYRTLDLLTELGVVTPLQLDGDATVYHRADHRHGHLVCAGCGAIVEIPEPRVAVLAGSSRTRPGSSSTPDGSRSRAGVRACAGKDSDARARAVPGHRRHRRRATPTGAGSSGSRCASATSARSCPTRCMFSWELLDGRHRPVGLHAGDRPRPGRGRVPRVRGATTLDLPILVCAHVRQHRRRRW